MRESESTIHVQRSKDLQHLNLLSIFHFVYAGMSLLGICLLGVHYLMMQTLFTSPQLWEKSPQGAPPQELFSMLLIFYAFAGFMLLLCGVFNLTSGFGLLQRKNRMLSLVVAGFNCLQFPLGTALGVCTFIVLLRESVVELYEPTSTEGPASSIPEWS